jgi:hypothetical protein
MFGEQWERMLHTLEAVTAWFFSKDRLIRWGLWLVTIAKGVLVGLAIAGLCELIFSETVKDGLESAQASTQKAVNALQPLGLASAFIGKFAEPISGSVNVISEPRPFFGIVWKPILWPNAFRMFKSHEPWSRRNVGSKHAKSYGMIQIKNA